MLVRIYPAAPIVAGTSDKTSFPGSRRRSLRQPDLNRWSFGRLDADDNIHAVLRKVTSDKFGSSGARALRYETEIGLNYNPPCFLE